MPRDESIKKVLVIGSGPIVIGQAAEFDYAGAQACRVLKAEGVNVVLVNSNPATIMTDNALADEIYLEPLTAETIKRIILKEKPDSVLAGLGGQTGLTIAMQLDKEHFFEKTGVRLLGTDAAAISKAEDRQLFKDTMKAIGQPTIPSKTVEDVDSALKAADEIGYPVIVRPAFTLGGAGGGVAYDANELRSVAKTGLNYSPITQVLVEKYIKGFKEIEFETMRDRCNNCIAVCSMENFDPVGIHTGDSIVTAPCLTLSDKEFQMLRSSAINMICALGIVGGCNCQFALSPDSFTYYVIEVNPRVSRSSALASKATGYPIAKITTKIALGYTLDEIPNDITGRTCACFEPTLDYVVVKFPKWPFDKFVGADRTLGTQMKATGEVMSIAQSFEAAVMKAVRGAEIGLDTLNSPPAADEDVLTRLHRQDDKRIFTVFEALKAGITPEQVNRITGIDKWFICKLRNLVRYEQSIQDGMDEDKYLTGKRLGYTDAALKKLSGAKTLPARRAVYKMVDTCGAEFDAETPYFYSAYDETDEAAPFIKPEKPKILVLGSGPIRIGQGIEFDYSSVHCVWALKKLGYEVIIVNNNPETVSTDYDTADRLYFEPLCPEDVMNIIRVERPLGVVVAFGGQTAIKLTKFLDENGITIFGTSAEGIDTAEDRERFDALLERFSIRRPKGMGVMTKDEAVRAAAELGYPVLLRPSYVIGGQNMTIAHNEAQVRRYMDIILAQKIENPVLVDKYMMGPELEVDVISDGRDVLIPGIMEHIERAGVHSGDSIAVYPPYNLNDKMIATLIESSTKLALSLGTKGLVNIQYLICHGELYVIEVNPRASRTVPYISKVTGVPMVDLASKVMTGLNLRELGFGTGLYRTPPYCAVKVPVFSFEKLTDVNSYLGPEMKSTGEVLGIGKNLSEALYKGMTSAGIRIEAPKSGRLSGVLISVDEHDQYEILTIAKKFDDLGFRLYCTTSTAEAIGSLGIDVENIGSIRDDKEAVIRLLESGRISCIVYTGAVMDSTVDDYTDLHRRALQLSIPCLTSLDTANALADIIASRYNEQNTELVDINNMRSSRTKLPFRKMHCAGSDYICIDNRTGLVTCPESLCITLCDRSSSIGADGIFLLENSERADVGIKIFNRDGSRSRMSGGSLICLAKYVYDTGICRKENLTIETEGGICSLKLYIRNNEVNTVCLDLGAADFDPAHIPAVTDKKELVDTDIEAGGQTFRVTCLSLGNPHCVIFADDIDHEDPSAAGALLESSPIFPERVNTEFVLRVNENILKMRSYERGVGEMPASGSGAAAAAAAAVRLGLCAPGTDITVKTEGGDFTVCCTPGHVTLTANAGLAFEGTTEY